MEKSSLMMIIIIALLVALLATVVGVTLFAFNAFQNMETAAHADHSWVREERILHPEQITRIPIGDSIITNLASDGGNFGGVARVQVLVGYDNTQGSDSNAIASRINDQMTLIRTITLAALQERSYQELTARGAMDDLGADILYRLQNDFMTNMIVEVSFYEWMIQ